jgi:hypothetical protein
MSEEEISEQTSLQRSYGTNWTQTNIDTIIQWICISSFKINILDEAINYYRNIIRNNVIFGLILSTASGTISATRFGLNSDDKLGFVLNTIFTAMSFSIAIFTGAIKVYQIQERLEEYIKMKQEWITFSAKIASELQLPIKLRKDALFIIIKNKAKYLDLLKLETEIPNFIKLRVENKMKYLKFEDYGMQQGTSLSQIILGIVRNEECRIINTNKIEYILDNLSKLDSESKLDNNKDLPKIIKDLLDNNFNLDIISQKKLPIPQDSKSTNNLPEVDNNSNDSTPKNISNNLDKANINDKINNEQAGENNC